MKRSNLDFPGVDDRRKIMRLIVHDTSRDDVFDSIFNAHADFLNFFLGSKYKKTRSGIGCCRNKDVDRFAFNVFPHFPFRSPGDESEGVQSLAWKFDENHHFKGIGIGISEGNHDLFGAAIDSSDKWDFFHDGFTQMQQFFAKNICGQNSHQQDNKEGHGETKEGDAVSLRYGSASLNQEFREKGGESVQILKKELQDKKGDRNG